eukprot:scpid18564/ scgid9814/ 
MNEPAGTAQNVLKCGENSEYVIGDISLPYTSNITSDYLPEWHPAERRWCVHVLTQWITLNRTCGCLLGLPRRDFRPTGSPDKERCSSCRRSRKRLCLAPRFAHHQAVQYQQRRLSRCSSTV